MAEANTRSLARAVPFLLMAGCGEPDGRLPFPVTDTVPEESGVDYALSFDGLGQYATMANSLFAPAHTEQSVSLWFSAESVEGDRAMLTMRRNFESGHHIGLADGWPSVRRVENLAVLVQGPQPVIAGQWHHFAYVELPPLEGSTLPRHRLYLDGEFVVENVSDLGHRTPTASWLGTVDGLRDFFHGRIDNLRVWRRSLSGPEVATDMEAQVAAQDSLVVDYSFNDVPGTARVYDRSGVGNHATLGDGIDENKPTHVRSDRP
jgi:hypothetical protein